MDMAKAEFENGEAYVAIHLSDFSYQFFFPIKILNY